AARLRLRRVILALALLHTAGQRVFSSGPTIQLGSVIIAARLRPRRAILALALLHTAVRRDLSSGSTQLGSVIAAARLQLGRVMLQSPDTDSSLCTSIPIILTPKEARRVRHEKLVNTKMEPSLDPDDYIQIKFTFDPGGRFCEYLEETGQTVRDELCNGSVLQRLPVEYERIRHASYE
ncbi:unnamed protein product, partial [Laminaria digitata]